MQYSLSVFATSYTETKPATPTSSPSGEITMADRPTSPPSQHTLVSFEGVELLFQLPDLLCFDPLDFLLHLCQLLVELPASDVLLCHHFLHLLLQALDPTGLCACWGAALACDLSASSRCGEAWGLLVLGVHVAHDSSHW